MDFIFSPLNQFWILTLLAFVLYKRRKKKAARFCLMTGITVLFLFSISPLPVVLGRWLEQQYAPLTATPSLQGRNILILGSGHTDDPSLPPLQQLSRGATARLNEGVRQYYMRKGSKLICSGYSEKGRMSQAETLARAALSLGVPASDTLTNTRPHNTWQEALEYKHRFGAGKPFVLVTSATHMPRAMAIFRRNGLKPEPAPALYLFKNDRNSMLYNWSPSVDKLYASEKIIHELAGLAYYKWVK